MRKLFLLSSLLISVIFTYGQCPVSVDFNTWHGERSVASSWTISGGGSVIEHNDNGNNMFYVNNSDLVNIEMTGSIEVHSSNDDDFVGLVCGYKNPTGSPTNNYDFYLIDWKQITENWGTDTAFEGYNLCDANGDVSTSPHFFGHTDNPPLFDVLQRNYGPSKGWVDFTTHNLKLIYTTSDIILIVDNDTVINYQDCFDAGQVGIYNFSQEHVLYSNFAINHITDFTYSNICADDTANFKYIDLDCAPSFDPSFITSMTWDYGDGNTFTNSSVNLGNINPSHIYNTAGTYTVQLSVTDVHGCTDIKSHQISIGQMPYLTTNANTPLCEGEDLQLATTTYTGANYTWTGPNAFSSNLNNPIVNNVSLLDSGLYIVSAQIGNCSDIDSVLVDVNVMPFVTLSSNSPLCVGDNLILNSSSVVGANYTWSGPNSFSSTIPNPTVTNVVLQDSGYYVITTTLNGCSDEDSVFVSVNPMPNLILSSNSPLCEGSDLLITASNYTGANYTWTGPNSFSSGTQNATVNNITLLDSGYYVVSVQFGSCGDIDSIKVVINEQPNITVSSNSPLCINDNLLLTANSSIGATYSWSGPNSYSNSTPNPTIPNVNISESGYYVASVTNNGCSNKDSVLVVVNNKPTITSITSNSPLCAGDNLTLTSSSNTAGSTFGWTGPNSFTSSSQNPIRNNVSVIDSGYYYVYAENSSCRSNLDSIRVIINKAPTSTFTASQIMCYGDSSRLVYTGDALSTAIFTWSYDGGSTSGNSVTWTDEGNHDVTLTVSEGSCSTTTTVTVLNPDSLYSSYSVNNISCFGLNDGEITLNVNGGTPTYTYSWSTGNGSNLTAGEYVVTITDANTCKNIKTIQVVEPSEIIVFAGNDTTLCSGGTVNLLASVTGGTSPINYLWDGISGTATNTVNPQTTQTYTAQVKDANGCYSNIDNVTIYVNTPVEINLIMNTDSVCPGDEIIISPMISHGDGGPYTIYYENGTLISPPIIINPDSSYNLVVFAKDLCGSRNSDTAKIHTLPLPENNFYFDKNNICQNESVQFNESNPDIPGTLYLWNFGDNNNLSYDKNPSHSFDTPGSFNVSLTVTSPKGCEKIVKQNGAIIVYPNPIANFQAYPATANIISPTINFYNYSSITDTCIWTFSDGDTLNNVEPKHIFKNAGTYKVQLIVGSINGCKDTAYTNVLIEDQQTLYVPTAFTPDFDGNNDIFKVFGHGIKDRNFSLRVFDRWGNEVFSTNDINEGWTGLDYSDRAYMNGTYTYVVVYENLIGEEIKKVGSFNLIR